MAKNLLFPLPIITKLAGFVRTPELLPMSFAGATSDIFYVVYATELNLRRMLHILVWNPVDIEGRGRCGACGIEGCVHCLRGIVRWHRKTLNAAKCDLWPGVVSVLDTVTVTQPYYRSTYVYVSRKESALQSLTLDDPRLKQRLIGVQMIGNDATNTPPAHAIASRGITDNVRGYMLVGDYGRPNPKAAIIDALADGTIEVALVRGTLAGYFAQASSAPLRIELVTPANDARWPMAFDISLGLRRGDFVLRDKLNATLERDKAGGRNPGQLRCIVG